MVDFSKELAEMDKAHLPSSVPDRSFSELPDGDYQCRLDKIYLSTSQKGNLMTVIELEVQNGEQRFRKIWIYRPMVNSKQLDRLTNDLRVLGLPLNFKWNEVEKYFPSLLDNFYLVRLVTKVQGEEPVQYKNLVKPLKSDDVMVSSAVAKKGDVPF